MLRRLQGAEWGLALVLTLVVLCLHLMAVISAGPLWRDEANTVAVATLPRLGDVWRNLQFDSFPMLWMLLVRGMAAVFGPMNDVAFRFAGFLVGAGIVAALWLNARQFGRSPPLISLSLLAINPSLIRWGDTVRGYGLGLLLILVTCALLWRFADRPSAGRFVAAAVAAIASVHVLYYNAVLLLAFCAAAVAVCAHRRAWKPAAAVMLIGAVAAISLIPYANTISNAKRWNMLVEIPTNSAGWYWSNLGNTLNAGGFAIRPIWVALLGTAIVLGTLGIFARRLRLPQIDREVLLFSLVSVLVGLPCLFVFLRILSYHTQPWYYLPLLVLAGVCIDAILTVLIRAPAARVARIVVVILTATVGFIPAKKAVQTRLSDVDLVAAKLDSIADFGDVVIVTPWQYGVSFSRYYRGAANWVTIPQLSPARIHRYDLEKKEMTRGDQAAPAQPAIERMRDALRAGRTVFVAGVPAELPPGETRAPPPAPWPGGVWSPDAHEDYWSITVSRFLERHAIRRREVPVATGFLISRYEDLSLEEFEGWRE